MITQERPMYAPEEPTLRELQDSYALTLDEEQRILIARQRVSRIICGEEAGFIAILGPCAMTNAEEIIDAEGEALEQLASEEPELAVLDRLPPWKPRSKREDWHGRETDDPEGAYATLSRRAKTAANVEIELGHPMHTGRYSNLITMGRIGGRNVENDELIQAVALHDRSLPIGIKNGLDGTIDVALEQIQKVEKLRDGGAPAVLIYRGGTNAQSPEEWEDRYLEVLARTNGQVIVDGAHGTEMAHDPNGKFEKSVEGQTKAIRHIIRLARQGYMPLGVMLEASEAHSPTDPHMSFQDALASVRELNHIRTGMRSRAA